MNESAVYVKNTVYGSNNRAAAETILRITGGTTDSNYFRTLDLLEAALDAAEFKGKCQNRPEALQNALEFTFSILKKS